jgi:nucleoside-diphosphate-sugar epimerase
VAQEKRLQRSILVTGASGFIGRHFINAIKDDFIIYAIARRNQHEAKVPLLPNIQWIPADLGDRERVRWVGKELAEDGGVDYIFHFAGYYDFTNEDHPEYARTNVEGTRNLLEMARDLGVKRFVFSSSLTVTEFSKSGTRVSENSPLDAAIPYARSKQAAEELIREYSQFFPCTIVRLAAIFSDWCEYGPLYFLLRKWLGKSGLAQIIPGKGLTGLPYLHVRDLIKFFLRILEKEENLSDLDVLLASPDGCLTHNELFRAATLYAKGETGEPLHVPVPLLAPGVLTLQFIRWLRQKPSFERLWMLKYLDRQLEVDASRTMDLLDWQPTERYRLKRRILFLVENMKTSPNQWEERNIVMAHKKLVERPGVKIFEAMEELKDEIIAEHVLHLLAEENKNIFPHYQELDEETLKIRADCIYEMLEVAILNGDRKHALIYAGYLARERYKAGIGLDELGGALRHTASITEKKLLEQPALAGLAQKIHDEINITMQLVLDEIEDVYHHLKETQTGAG